jgi:hypothetical protein
MHFFTITNSRHFIYQNSFNISRYQFKMIATSPRNCHSSKFMGNYVWLSLNKLHLKIEFKDNIFWTLQIIALNLEASMCGLCKASATLLESVSKLTWFMPRLAISFIASSNVKASPSIMEHLHWIHVVLAVINLPMWSRIHHPALVLYFVLWNPASTLHLNQPKGGCYHCSPSCCCCVLKFLLVWT